MIQRNLSAIRMLRAQILFFGVRLRLRKSGYRERSGRMWIVYRKENDEPLFAFSECDLWESGWRKDRAA